MGRVEGDVNQDEWDEFVLENLTETLFVNGKPEIEVSFAMVMNIIS
jgi:hypothetical protein